MPTWQLQEVSRGRFWENPFVSLHACLQPSSMCWGKSSGVSRSTRHKADKESPSQTGAGHPGLMRAPSEAANGQQKHRRTEWLSALWYAAVLSDLLVIFLAGVFAPPGVKGHQGNQACSRSSCVRPHLWMRHRQLSDSLISQCEQAHPCFNRIRGTLVLLPHHSPLCAYLSCTASDAERTITCLPVRGGLFQRWWPIARARVWMDGGNDSGLGL